MELTALVCRYAERFAELGGGRHHVSSPLGAWLVLALAAPAATGKLAEVITDALGTDVDTAHRAATDLLSHPHPTVAVAAAAWTRPGLVGLNGWTSGLPAPVATGPIPTQEQADAWAREHTLGLIERFPLDVDSALILLASALAARVSWAVPFELAPAAELRGPWSTELTQVLRTPRRRRHHAFIADTARAGRVVVHTADAEGLQVTSVIAAHDVAPPDVLAATHQICVAWAAGNALVPSVSLFDLPLGDHPLWTIAEQHAPKRGEYVEALLPAWHADSTHDLCRTPELAFVAAAQSLQVLAGLGGDIAAAQRAVARYGRRGFEAAAVTALAVSLGLTSSPPPGPYRTATARFAHPYAVVATTRGRNEPRHGRNDPWHGLPVFAAWITRPDDAHE